MTKIHKEYHVMASLEEVWKALTDAREIEKWGGGPVKMSEDEGKAFSLWGGDIHGKNTEVIRGEKLIQEWYGGDWPKPSKVTFRLTHNDGCTAIYLDHQGVPEKELKDFDAGWDTEYLGAIKKHLER